MKTSTLRELPRQVFHPSDAERYFKDDAGRPYRPSNGTEGEIFEAAWCGDCRRHRSAESGGCSIAVSAFAYAIDDPDYPTEWRYGDDGQPLCTAFSDKHAPRPAYRCQATDDLFSEPAAPHPDKARTPLTPTRTPKA